MRCILPVHVLWLFPILSTASGNLVSRLSATNRTIDDVYGDSVTGAQVQYLPAVPASDERPWVNQTSCTGCVVAPDAAFALDNTWTVGMYLADIQSMSINLKFSGTAIYVFFIIPNLATNADQASTVQCLFFIDEELVGTFKHNSDGSGHFIYDTLVYGNSSVPDGEHTLIIETNGSDPSIMIFDYVLYTPGTTDEHVQMLPSPAPSSTPASVSSPTTVSPGQENPTTTNAQPHPSFDHIPVSPFAPITLLSFTPLSTAAPSLASKGYYYGVPSGSSLASAATHFVPVTAPTGTIVSRHQSTSLAAIVGGIIGALILIILVFVFVIVYRRRRRRLEDSEGTISVFDLLPENPDPPPSEVQRRSPRALLIPPMSQCNSSGRSIDATPTKKISTHELPRVFASPGPSGFHGHAHSIKSSVSSYSDAHSDLHIHIPGLSYHNLRSPSPGGLPLPLTPLHSATSSHPPVHSPIVTPNGVHIPPPEEADIVRDFLQQLAAAASEGSFDFSPSMSTDTGEDSEEDIMDAWYESDLTHPMVHVDSGIRISRAMMELPPVYAAT